MKYTTKQFRVDGGAKHIQIFQSVKFIELYSTLVYLWGDYTDFSKIPFPNPVTKLFPVTSETMLPAGKEFSW
jgi:hypothetical protein